MKLDEVTADVAAQLDQQADLGVQIDTRNEVPEKGPVNKGLWFQIPNVTAVFADMKGSTALNSEHQPRVAARAYTYFVRAMTVTLERFSAGYIDIHGDGIFGLFSEGLEFEALASAITMKTLVKTDVAGRFKEDSEKDWDITAGIGIDQGRLLVRRLGLRGTKLNEVWAGKPVNIAAKLSSVAGPNELVVSNRVFDKYENASRARRRAIIRSCGCNGGTQGDGWDAPESQTTELWDKESAPQGLGLDFESIHRLESKWCSLHGAEFCEAIITNQRTGR